MDINIFQINRERLLWGKRMNKEEEEAEKARVWLMGQNLTKSKFNKEAYLRNKEAMEREEAEEKRIEEEERKAKENT